jgi:hypothetical protein
MLIDERGAAKRVVPIIPRGKNPEQFRLKRAKSGSSAFSPDRRPNSVPLSPLPIYSPSTFRLEEGEARKARAGAENRLVAAKSTVGAETEAEYTDEDEEEEEEEDEEWREREQEQDEDITVELLSLTDADARAGEGGEGEEDGWMGGGQSPTVDLRSGRSGLSSLHDGAPPPHGSTTNRSKNSIGNAGEDGGGW